jgi:hypothetical protein
MGHAPLKRVPHSIDVQPAHPQIFGSPRSLLYDTFITLHVTKKSLIIFRSFNCSKLWTALGSIRSMIYAKLKYQSAGGYHSLYCCFPGEANSPIQGGQGGQALGGSCRGVWEVLAVRGVVSVISRSPTRHDAWSVSIYVLRSKCPRMYSMYSNRLSVFTFAGTLGAIVTL